MGQYLTNSDIIILSGSSLAIGNSTPNASLDVSGSGIISGSLKVIQGITGSLFGTSSWAISSSQTVTAQTASYVVTAQTASYVLQAVSASFATTASYVKNAQTASYVLQAVSASFATTASYVVTAQTASYVTGSVHNSANPALSASYALTASYALNAGSGGTVSTASLLTTASVSSNTITFTKGDGSTFPITVATGSGSGGSTFPYTGSAIISGSLVVTGSITSTLGFTGSLFGTSSWAISASQAVTASYVTGSIFTNSNSAASASYAATASYAAIAGNGGVTKILAGANVNLSPVNGLGDVTVTSFGTNLYNTATGSYGSFYDTGSILATSATAVYSMSLSTTDISNGVFVSASGGDITRVKFTNAGTYNVQFSSQFSNTDNSNQDIIIWVKKNGVDVPDSSGIAAAPPFKAGSNGQVIASWNYYLSLSAGDYIQICWHVEQANVITLETIAAGTSPTHPRTPSTILTAQRVDTFLSNTGSFSGSFNGVFTGSLQGTSSWAINAATASNIGPSISPDGSNRVLISNGNGTMYTTANLIYTGSTLTIIDSLSNGLNTIASGSYSHAEGIESIASGSYSHAEGAYTIANGDASHAEGEATTANGYVSHAEGSGTTANGYASHAEGTGTRANGQASHAKGQNTVAAGSYAHAEGVTTIAQGNRSHTEGNGTITGYKPPGIDDNTVAISPPIVGASSKIVVSFNGNYTSYYPMGSIVTIIDDGSNYLYTDTLYSSSYNSSANSTTVFFTNYPTGSYVYNIVSNANNEGYGAHAEGQSTTAIGQSSHAEGFTTTANGLYSHAEGEVTTANGDYSHAEGSNTITSGSFSHAEGSGTIAVGSYSHAEGCNTLSSVNYSHAEGFTTTANGLYSHAEGSSTTTNEAAAHAEGAGTTANGYASHAEGSGTTANGEASHAEGGNTNANGFASHAEGEITIANIDFSHTEGSGTTANGYASHAEGSLTTTYNAGSHAEGLNTQTYGDFSHAEGVGTITSASYQHAQGMYNIASAISGAFILGNGTSDASRSNLIFAAGNTVQITGSLNVSGSITGSLLGTASYATTASYALNGGSGAAFPYTGSAIITGSLVVTGSITATTGFSGSLQGTASYATTASYALNAGGASTNLEATVAWDGNGSFVSTGNTRYVVLPNSGTINGWSIVAIGTSPTMTVDVLYQASGTTLPTASIAASALPALSTGNVISSTTLTGWTSSLAAGGVLGFRISASANILQAKIALTYK
jgi:hypothetical protein